MAFAEDLTKFFDVAGFAQAATWGALSANVILDTPTEDQLGGKALGVAFDVTLPASSWPNIARGASVTIAAVSYTVREVRLLDDGALKKLALQK